MFWSLYVVTSILLSAILTLLSKKYTVQVFILLLVIFITPAQIEIQNRDYAPSLFTFFLTSNKNNAASDAALSALA